MYIILMKLNEKKFKLILTNKFLKYSFLLILHVCISILIQEKCYVAIEKDHRMQTRYV